MCVYVVMCLVQDFTINRMTTQQPGQFMIAQTNDQWSSGICDCCDNVPECESLSRSFSVVDFGVSLWVYFLEECLF